MDSIDELNAQIALIHAAYPQYPALIPLKYAAQFVRRDPRTLLADASFPAKKRGRSWDVPVVSFARWCLEK